MGWTGREWDEEEQVDCIYILDEFNVFNKYLLGGEERGNEI